MGPKRERDHRAGAALADEVWRHLEPLHAVVYFAPEHRAACDEIGLRGGWMAYFASRAAPLGAVGHEVVAALFYNFHPAMVARALPDAWSFAAPVDVLAARYRAVDAALRRLLGGRIDGPEVAEAAVLATELSRAADVAGRPMFAANLGVDAPPAPHLALWHAATLLREHRGDGHVAALQVHGVDGCQAHVLQVAGGTVRRRDLQPNRGWSDDDWETATAALVERGWIDDGGNLTGDGRRARADIGEDTARLASWPVEVVGRDLVERLVTLLGPLVDAVDAGQAIPYPNPMGVPRRSPAESR